MFWLGAGHSGLISITICDMSGHKILWLMSAEDIDEGNKCGTSHVKATLQVVLHHLYCEKLWLAWESSWQAPFFNSNSMVVCWSWVSEFFNSTECSHIWCNSSKCYSYQTLPRHNLNHQRTSIKDWSWSQCRIWHGCWQDFGCTISRFTDPTTVVTGVYKYVAAVKLLFDPELSQQELLSINVTGPHTIEANWRLGGYFLYLCCFRFLCKKLSMLTASLEKLCYLLFPAILVACW